ncbi:polysaccharide biosynthesis protein [Ancylobacter vacuolatus]|uniref:FlaA1/EpsC-like NDP-sugar epimerase n=1 Tax=Ancylobacter vacuolatus TaxID=223389 RepID=A0ABU0DKN3_9HYPH|nr:nucleoside-diphosphate sugar epimerase/dehydratase [Ancylobacter vacuolatus]MDQ0348998.1 FlaA1/EpsC-like NDP-sugar epimerase [Ancylobacter vacuolatus]
MTGGALNYLIGLSRAKKRAVLYFVDASLLTASFFLAMALRLDSFSLAFAPESWAVFAIVLPLTIVLLHLLGLYRVVVRHISSRTLRELAIGAAISSAMLLAGAKGLGLFLPRSVPIIYWLLAMVSLGGARFGLRALYLQRQSRLRAPVVIYGAGRAGQQLLASLQGSEYAPVAFVDDAPELQGRDMGGYRVHPTSALVELVAEYEVENVLLAIPSATRLQRKLILERLVPLGLRVRTIPGITDIVSGRAQLTELREVSIEDLLGRDLIPPQQELLDANIRGKVVMVTGAGGSIGSELCRQILRQGPARLVLLELSEYALYSVDQELRQLVAAEDERIPIVPLLASVTDRPLIEGLLRRFKVDTLFHAAAYKHVPLVEHNVVEGVRNNVFGTLILAEAALACGVGAFVLISTDKAVRPTNIMGASKRMAELVCQTMAAQAETVFSIVRFGNVLGSSGSVIPLFRQQIEAGGPITVTHPEITRYFMAIPEAAQLVIQAGAMARGGDVFILDMGEPVRIVDLAIRMARLSGLTPVIAEGNRREGAPPDGDIEIRFTGLRPGEKLYEELLIGGVAQETQHPRIMTTIDRSLTAAELNELLRQLEAACDAQDIPGIRAILSAAPTGYVPDDGIADLFWQAREAAPQERRPLHG